MEGDSADTPVKRYVLKSARQPFEWPQVEYYNPVLDKCRDDVAIHMEFLKEEGLCQNIDCGDVNGGNNLTDNKPAEVGSRFCRLCHKDIWGKDL